MPAVVTLHPLFLPDILPFRSLTFASGLDTINVGRASKRENKNLTPAHHNAWFESRVMSRDHASLSVSLGSKVVYVRDNGSMHGTWVNDKKIPPGRDVAISTDDVLTFGAEVMNGSVTFAPLRARCECQWFDPREEETSSKPALPQRPNSFCVPDDDDDASDVYSVWGDGMVASADDNTADVAYDSVSAVNTAVASADDDTAGAAYGSIWLEDESTASTDDDAADASYDSVPVDDTAVASADNDAADVAHDSVP
ncbi:FHA domain protein, partial [Aspergillus sp. HF37]